MSEIVTFQTRNGVVLPRDMAEYFSAINGMGELGTTDDDLFCFFRLQDLASIADRVPDRASRFHDAHRYFIFADHSISLPSYAIRLHSGDSDANPVASVYTDGGALEVEDFFESFSDFVRHYLDDPNGTCVTFPNIR